MTKGGNMTEKDKQLQLVQQLAEIVEELGWVVAIPLGDAICDGIIMGTEEYVLNVVKSYYKDDIEVLSPNPGTELSVDIVESEKKKFH